MYVRGSLQLVHSKRNNSSSEANIGNTEKKKNSWEDDELVQNIDITVEALQRETNAHDGKAYPSDPEADSNDIMLAGVRIRYVAGDGEHDLSYAMDH